MDFNGNPNIGIYIFVNNKFCLIGPEVSKEKSQEIEKTFGVPVYKISILNTELVGIFASGDDNNIFVPELFDYEREALKSICEKHECNLIELDEIKNTYGNNLCVGDNTILINAFYPEKFYKKLEKLGYKVSIVNNKKFDSVGSTAKYLNGFFFFSQEYDEADIEEEVKDKVSGVGTINSGSNYISSGVVGNNNGVIIGSSSTSIEIQNIVESLDYL